jgi:hypothetical protein
MFKESCFLHQPAVSSGIINKLDDIMISQVLQSLPQLLLDIVIFWVERREMPLISINVLKCEILADSPCFHDDVRELFIPSWQLQCPSRSGSMPAHNSICSLLASTSRDYKHEPPDYRLLLQIGPHFRA